MRLHWLADVLRAAGLPVVEVDGWAARGAEYTVDPLAVICHETQGSATSTDKGEIGVLVNGRSGLPGPIAQLYLSRSGTWHVVASGRCNQVKTGWGGPLEGKGNSYSFGIEAQHAVSEDWAAKPAQYESYVRGVAAICAHLGWPVDGHVVGHKEHQPGDKSDPEFNMATFRQDVADILEDDVSKTSVIEGVAELFAEAATRATKNGRRFGDSLNLIATAQLRPLTVAAEEDRVRDQAVLTAVTALASAGGVDSAPIVAAITALRDEFGTQIGQLRADLAASEARETELREQLAEAYATSAGPTG